jgi:hypothetical protein
MVNEIVRTIEMVINGNLPVSFCQLALKIRGRTGNHAIVHRDLLHGLPGLLAGVSIDSPSRTASVT